MARYLKLKPPSYVPNREEVINDIRKTVGGAILDPEDQIKDVLDDNDFISIGERFWFISCKKDKNVSYSLTLLEFSITTKLIFYLVLETDRPDPKLQNAEIKYVPEQM